MEVVTNGMETHQRKVEDLENVIGMSVGSKVKQDYVRQATQSEHPRSKVQYSSCLLYTSPSPRDKRQSRMPSSA